MGCGTSTVSSAPTELPAPGASGQHLVTRFLQGCGGWSCCLPPGRGQALPHADMRPGGTVGVAVSSRGCLALSPSLQSGSRAVRVPRFLSFSCVCGGPAGVLSPYLGRRPGRETPPSLWAFCPACSCEPQSSTGERSEQRYAGPAWVLSPAGHRLRASWHWGTSLRGTGRDKGK